MLYLLNGTKSLISKFEEKQIYRCMCILFPFMLTNCSIHYHIIYTYSVLYNLNQSYCRIVRLLGRNLIENLTVLRFSNLVFESLWSRTYIPNVQVNLVSKVNVVSPHVLLGTHCLFITSLYCFCRWFCQRTWLCRQEGNRNSFSFVFSKQFYIILFIPFLL